MDLDRATRALGRHNITFSLDTDNNPKVRIMVDPRDASAAIDVLAQDAKEAKSKSK